MTIQLEIDKDKLMYLFEQGVLCAADFRCLNSISKQQVAELCLSNCAKHLQSTSCIIPINMHKLN
ncbi:hypothetical protein E2R68_03940 [Psychromonas sp. RZ22]|uniref:hypothetical protein n=1 Tax=Psychromonas algarum TaxID=2555643 RepID=UPI0010687525|nr:hypothetical protein [Psychromonas sp. RZ22]TEW55547.1 hypothetical protein E2R68_03940 [Psychromonas sp. RZ22]